MVGSRILRCFLLRYPYAFCSVHTMVYAFSSQQDMATKLWAMNPGLVVLFR